MSWLPFLMGHLLKELFPLLQLEVAAGWFFRPQTGIGPSHGTRLGLKIHHPSFWPQTHFREERISSQLPSSQAPWPSLPSQMVWGSAWHNFLVFSEREMGWSFSWFFSSREADLESLLLKKNYLFRHSGRVSFISYFVVQFAFSFIFSNLAFKNLAFCVLLLCH